MRISQNLDLFCHYPFSISFLERGMDVRTLSAKVAEEKNIKKRPNDNNNQSFEKELVMNTEKLNGK